MRAIAAKVLAATLVFGFTVCLRAQTNDCELVVIITQSNFVQKHYIKTNGLVYSFGSFVNETNQIRPKALLEIYRDASDFYLLKTNKHALHKKYHEMDLKRLLVDDLQSHSPHVTLLITGENGARRELVWVPYDEAQRKKTFQGIQEEAVFAPMLTKLMGTITQGKN